MKPQVVAQRQGGKLMVSQNPRQKRVQELAGKSSKSQADVQEEILLRLQTIMEHLGIEG